MPPWVARSQCLTILLVNNLFLIPKGYFLPSTCIPCPVAVLLRKVSSCFCMSSGWELSWCLWKMTDCSCPDLPGAQETAETSCGTRGQRTCSVVKYSHCRDTDIQTLSWRSDTGQDSTSLSLWLTGKDHFWTHTALENHLSSCLAPQLNPFKFH